jgi:release factor glutamine methyltransferase
MTIDEWVNASSMKLKLAGIDSAKLDCLIILQSISGKDRNWILTHGDKLITDSALAKFDEMLNRRINREPLAYITGQKEFYGFNFSVGPDVLVPRPETEALVTYLVKEAPSGGRVLDIGTGSGCIAVASKLQRPDIHVTASDISKSALAIAQKNAKDLGAQIEFTESNLFSDIEGRFDFIAANLPYVPRGANLEPELSFEPELALFADEDGLALYEKFFLDVENFIAERGTIVIEHEPSQFSWLLGFTHRRAQRISNFITALN